MAKRLAGVAVAAVVGACALVGGAERAEALPFYQVFQIVTADNNTFKFQAGPMDTLLTDLSGIVQYTDGIQYRRNTDFTDLSGSFSYSITHTSQGTTFNGSIYGTGGNIGIYCEYGVCGNLYNDGYYNFSFSTSKQLGYGENFNLAASDFLSSSHYGFVFNDGFDTADGHEIGALESISYAVVPVPLPSPIMLLGFSLVALGGFSRARRRENAS